MRLYSLSLTCLLVTALFASQYLSAQSFKIATWNVEHLNEDNDTGCIPRTDDDYEYIKGRIDDLSADVVAIQEVESEVAALRVFPESEWDIIMSDRPNKRGSDGGSICWGTDDKRLRHQATGFAIRKGLNVEKHASYSDLAGPRSSQRWGTDVTLKGENESIRLLSVHLASGCWGPEQDESGSPRTQGICKTLIKQIQSLGEWIDERNEAGEAFVILGDFNRRLALEDDWAAEVLLAEGKNASLLTNKIRTQKTKAEWCDARYANLIDHFIVSDSLVSLVDPDSIIEHPRMRESPDHCIISAAFAL